MDRDRLLQQFVDVAGISLAVIQNGKIVEYMGGTAACHAVLEAIFASLPERQEELWTAMAPEDFFIAGLHQASQERHLLIAPVFAYECSTAQVRSILNRLGQQPEGSAAFLRELNRLRRYDINELYRLLVFIQTWMEGAEAGMVRQVQFQWKRNITGNRPSITIDPESGFSGDLENHIVTLIRYGKCKELRQYFNETLFSRHSDGASGLINVRQMRRYMIGANMYMSRVAAAEGVDLNLISEYVDVFGERIENTSALSDFNHLFLEFSLRYTQMVADLTSLSSKSLLANQVNRYVQSHLYENIRLEDIARELKYSKTYVSAEFKKATDSTVTDFILRSKVREACYLLEQQMMPVFEISEALGFYDASYFIHVFKKFTGCTPGRFADRYQGLRALHVIENKDGI